MTNPLVTVTAYAKHEDARDAKGVLDSAGIDAVVDAAAAQRMKVRVENLHALRAGDVLNALGTRPSEIDEADEEERERVCPSCDARDIAPARRARTFVLTAAAAAAIAAGAGVAQPAFFAVAAAGVFLLIRGRWRCVMCGETFD